MHRCGTGIRFLLAWAVCLPPLFSVLPGQQGDRKPVLIRPDEAEGKAEESPFVPSPEEARRHVEVGEFYLKRKNYPAAVQRFREAVRHDPRWPEAYEKLARALEKQEGYREAARVCDEFVAFNPASPEKPRFEKWSRELSEKADRAPVPAG